MVDWRRLDWRGVTPQPPAAIPGDLGSGEAPDDDWRPWLEEPGKARRAARRRTALLAGLPVVAVIVAWLVYRRFQR